MADITVTDRDGQPHTFPEGTSVPTIQAELARRRAAATPQPGQPLQQPGMMPQGTSPAGFNTNPQSTLDMRIPELSAEGQRAMRMIEGGGAIGDRNMEQAGRILAEKDPTYQFRKEQIKQMAEVAGQRQAARLSGERIMAPFAKLLHSFNEAPDEVLHGAIGPRNTAMVPEKSPTPLRVPFTSWPNIPIPFTEGPTTYDPKTNAPVAGQISQVQREAILNPNDPQIEDAWNLQNRFGHGVHGITNALVSAAAKGIKMSDDRQKMFDSAMRDFTLASTRQESAKILGDALTIIQNDFHLTPEEADHILAVNLDRLAKDQQRKVLRNAAQVPPAAVADLLTKRGDKKLLRAFNKKYNDGDRGLAEHLIEAYSTAP